MARRTVNVDKLDRADIDTDLLQEFALTLVERLYRRADGDVGETAGKSHAAEEDYQKDVRRCAALKEVYEKLKAIPPRGEKWRHNLS